MTLKWSEEETLEAVGFLVSGLSHQWRSEAPGLSANGNIGWRLAAGHCQWRVFIHSKGWNQTLLQIVRDFLLGTERNLAILSQVKLNKTGEMTQNKAFFKAGIFKSFPFCCIKYKAVFSYLPSLLGGYIFTVQAPNCLSLGPLYTLMTSYWWDASQPCNSGPFHSSRFGQWTLSSY